MKKEINKRTIVELKQITNEQTNERISIWHERMSEQVSVQMSK